MKRLTRQHGFSLIEMLVSITIGMIVLSGAIYMTVAGMRAKTDSMRSARLNQGLRNVLLMVSQDIQRAGAWDTAQDVLRVSLDTGLKLSGTAAGSVTITPSTAGKDFSLINANIVNQGLLYIHQDGATATAYRATITAAGTNSLTATLASAFPTTDIPEGGWTVLPPTRGVDVRDATDNSAVVAGNPGTCIVMRYDLDKDGLISSGENMGYRYNAANGTVDVRKSQVACNGAATSWEGVTDGAEIQVTNFQVTEDRTLVVNGPLMNVVRTYTISVTGRLVRDNTVTRTLSARVKVRNDDVVADSTELASIEAGL